MRNATSYSIMILNVTYWGNTKLNMSKITDLNKQKNDFIKKNCVKVISYFHPCRPISVSFVFTFLSLLNSILKLVFTEQCMMYTAVR